MMSVSRTSKTLFWLIHKDLLRESRLPRVWPEMALLGVILVLLLALSTGLSAEQPTRLNAGLFWVAVFFAGTLAVDRSFAGESDGSCEQALQLYPIAPATLFTAKLFGNFAALTALELLLVPVFALLADIPLLHSPGLFAITAVLANLGYAAVGTLLSALTRSVGRQGNLLVLLLLPLAVPIVLATASATRAMLEDSLDPMFWRCIELLAAFAFLYTTLGLLVFEFVIEE